MSAFAIYATLVAAYMPKGTDPARVHSAAMHGWRNGMVSVDAARFARERARCPVAFGAWHRKRLAYMRQEHTRRMRAVFPTFRAARLAA